jgi:predicted MFS family arabinose efflux permease
MSAQRAVLAHPGVVPASATAAVAFIGIAAEPLAMLLLAREATGSFAAAGLVAAAYGVAAGAAAPGRGRALDRRGGTVLVPIAAWHLVAVGGLILAAQLRAPAAGLVATAAVAGIARSPIFGALRTLWSALVPAGELHAAYALQATLQQSSYLAGTLLAAALLAVSAPAVALAAATVLTFVAVLAFARTATLPGRPPAGSQRVIASRGLRVLALTAGLTTVTIGGLGVALTAFAANRGETPAAGILLAALTAGSIAGGLAYGSRSWPGALVRRYVVLLAAFAALAGALAAPRSLAPMLVAALLAGLPMAALMACRFALIDRVAVPDAANEAALWLSAAEAAGVAGGQALAGALVDGAGIAVAFLLIAIPSALAGLVALLARRDLDLEPRARAERVDRRRVVAEPDAVR